MTFSRKYVTAIQWCVNLHGAFELRGAVKGELEFDCTNAETNKAHLRRGGRSKNEREGEAKRKSRESSRDKRQETCLLKGKEIKGTFQFWMLSSIRYYCIQRLIPSFLHRWSGVDIAVKWQLTTQSERSRCTEWSELEKPCDPDGQRKQGFLGSLRLVTRFLGVPWLTSSDSPFAVNNLSGFLFLTTKWLLFWTFVFFFFAHIPTFSPVKCI